MFSLLYIIKIQVTEKLYLQVQLIVFMHTKIIFSYLVTQSLMGSLPSSVHRMDAANSDHLHYLLLVQGWLWIPKTTITVLPLWSLLWYSTAFKLLICKVCSLLLFHLMGDRKKRQKMWPLPLDRQSEIHRTVLPGTLCNTAQTLYISL